jgi:glycosyltransferase involved in cell wall biosynthesis
MASVSSLSASEPPTNTGHDTESGPTELTIVMPCLNEAETLATCIKKAKAFLDRTGVAGEVIVADNGSTDGSQAIARGLGARVVDVPVRGYGAALIAGIKAAKGKFVAMGDSDDSYDFARLDLFLEKLREGNQLAIASVSRQSRVVADWPHVLLDVGWRLSLRASSVRQSGYAAAESPNFRHGIRFGDGGKGFARQIANHRGPDHAVTGWPQQASAPSQLA